MDHVAAVYRLFDVVGKLLYIGLTKDFGRRWKQHAKEQPWWSEVHSQTVVWYDSRKKAKAAEDGAIAEEGPLYNKRGSPWELVKDEATGFYVIPRSKVKTVYKLRDATPREHAIELARMLREGQDCTDPALVEVLQVLTEVIRSYLAGSLQLLEAAPDLTDARKIRLGEMLKLHGVKGMMVRQIAVSLAAEGMAAPRETIHRWLVQYEREGLVFRPPVSAPFTQRYWVWAEAVDAA